MWNLYLVKINSSVKLYVAAIIAGGSIVIAAALFSLYKAENIQSIWLDFNQSRSEKNRVMSALREQIGFGGMIHNYKNYILRKDQLHKEKVLFSLGGAKATLSRYKTLPLNNEEKISINNINTTIVSYENTIDIIEKKIKQGYTAKQIDKVVKIDDALALIGFEALERNIHLNAINNNPILDSKSHLITSIRQNLGYGGMIHFYKNYILRHDVKLKYKAEYNLNSTLKYIESYSSHELNDIESKAINILTQNLYLYKEHLIQIKNFIAKGMSPRDIDKRVKVNDKPILDSLIILEQQTVLHDEIRANYLHQAIEFIVSSSKFIGGITLIIFFLIAAGSYWFVRLQIVKPIVALIRVMRKLSDNNFDVQIQGADTDNEIGDMAKSVEDFRDTAKARLEADKELLKINLELEQRVEERSRKLEYNQKLLQAIVEAAVDAIIVFDDDGNIQSFNAAAVKMFEYEPMGILGENINLLVAEDHKPIYPVNYKTNSNDELIIDVERNFNAVRKDGKSFPVEMEVGELMLENQKLFAGIIRDVSERHLHEEQIRRSQKMDALGKLTGGIAHDYNNMLGVIMGYAELLKEALSNNERLSGYATEVFKAGERGAKLTSKLLDFSRHKSSNEIDDVNINTIMLELDNVLKKTLTARIEVEYSLCDELWNVGIDVADFENALLNMAINAMHAILENGKLTLRTENKYIDNHLSSMLEIKSGDYIKLSVIDTGCGMDKETISHIFDPFYSTKAEQGTGLGLSQVYGFVQRSGGVIKVYSEPEYGTNFSIYLPRLIDDEITKSDVNLKERESADLNGNESILVVDDENALALLAKEILTSFGYKIFIAGNGVEALDVLENNNIDLILTDIVMPKMDGVTLAEQVRLKYPNILIQLASGYNTAGLSGGKVLDNEDVISKPYSLLVLVRKIRQLLDSRNN